MFAALRSLARLLRGHHAGYLVGTCWACHGPIRGNEEWCQTMGHLVHRDCTVYVKRGGAG